MTRLPIRWRVTLAFAAALLVVLLAVGAFLYLRFDAELSTALDQGLRTRSEAVAALVARSPAGVLDTQSEAVDADESFAQVIGADGTVIDATPDAGVPLLTGEQLARARQGQITVDREGDDRFDESARLRAAPVRAEGEPRVLVVGASLEEKREALAALLVLEVIGLTAALLAAAIVGYVVSGLALRPVEAMRRQAEAIGDAPDRRLPVPPVDDELGRLGTTLNRMLDRLDAGRRAERRFIADASHELRTPLTILKSEIEVAALGEPDVERLQAALASIGDETERLIGLAEDLLVLARADEGKLPIDLATLDVRDLLSGVAGRERRRAEAQGREIVVDAPAGLTVSAGRLRLEQALGNLVDNALRHGDGPVELRGGAGDGEVIIEVRDHGAGFDPELAEHAFERFSRSGAGRAAGGSGLGLAIVRAIAEAHGGSATAANAEPGAVVRITLPAR